MPPQPVTPEVCTDGWVISPNPVLPGNYLARLVAASAVSWNNVWAVGGRVPPGEDWSAATLIEHWDGSSWTAVPGAPDEKKGGRLNAVAAISANDVWAVGSYFSEGSQLIEHWDGRRWSIVAGPVILNGKRPLLANSLDAITAISPTDIWVLGHSAPYVNRTTVYRDVMEHWNGHAWRIVPSPQDTRTTGTGAMIDISGSSSTYVWAVGGRVNGFSEISGPAGAVVERWDGQKWSTVASPSGKIPLTKVAATSTDVWAVAGGDYTFGVGSLGFRPTEVVHWGVQQEWSTWLKFSTAIVTDLTAAGPRDVWLVGNKGDRPIIEHFDGTRWRVPANASLGLVGEHSQPPYRWLTSVSVTSDGTVVAFGGQQVRTTYQMDPPENRLWFQCGGISH